ncbi:MAG: N-acetylneuraminate synthase family protein, partial [Gammaproteobacteria bacterium]
MFVKNTAEDSLERRLSLFHQRPLEYERIYRFCPYVIAEAGVNHEGSLAVAKRQIEEAKTAGANAIKFQSYKAETLAAKSAPSYWDTTQEIADNQYDLFRRYDHFGPDDYQSLKAHCDRVGILFLSTPFDAEAVEYLAPLVPVFKIASADITNRPLIEQIGKKRKPIILSTGASTVGEIRQALSWLTRYNVSVVLL